MRHLYGVALAVLLAAAVFFGAGWGYQMVFDAASASVAQSSGWPVGGGGMPAGGGSLLTDAHIMGGGGLMLAVGLAIGLLMVLPRVSPLAAGLPGLVLVAWTVLYACDVREAVRLIPLQGHGYSTGFEVLLIDGLLGMAGIAMTIPLFVPSRWRRAPRVLAYAGPGPSEPAELATVSAGTGGPELAGFAAPSGGDSGVILEPTQTLPQRGQVIPPGGSPAGESRG